MLEDAPVKSEMYNMSISELPGQVYSGDQQCKHLYGPKASVCQFDLPNVSSREIIMQMISQILRAIARKLKDQALGSLTNILAKLLSRSI